ncbi:MAG: flagellar biosynthesis protein FliQ [Phycisphaerae bacterium]|nr:flagellar biosynthesis protein FliQ [Phycisphaerae bacterium]
MDVDEAIDLARQAVMLMLILGAPVLLTGLIVGVVLSVLQAATQVQEQTLSFVPKIIAMLLVAVLVGPWMLQRLIEFSREVFSTLP